MEAEHAVDDMVDKVVEDDLPGNEDDDEPSVCAICDNGGEILRCEGDCLRSFHPTLEAASIARSKCKSLGLSKDQVEAIPVFYCKNCLYKCHQCFACGELGSSDKSSGAEIFLCASGGCGRFYHPDCVARLLHRKSKVEAEELQQKIFAGEAFMCPSHRCVVCRGTEVCEVPELQFAICQRCPKSYHRKCLPKKIESRRSWDNLLPNHRILIYCSKHEIDRKLRTPRRNHIKFPNTGEEMESQASQRPAGRGKFSMKGRCLASKDASGRRCVLKPPKVVEKMSEAVKQGHSSKKRAGILSGADISKKQKVSDTSHRSLDRNSMNKITKVIDCKSRTSLGNGQSPILTKHPEPVIKRKENTSVSEHEANETVENLKKETSALPPLNADTKMRVIKIMSDAASSVALEDIVKLKRKNVSKTHACSSRNIEVNTITLGDVKRSIKALRLASEKLEHGCSIEEAKSMCAPELLNQIIAWQERLKVYLAPFLHGPCYTSYGRHFTKENKLEEIVNLLHWYVQEGDMIVDFCCGANDFSYLMKKKLEGMGKKCSYRNYDIFPAKNEINFEQRDWMTVETKELPSGSQLIMGLYPPFGVDASLENMLVKHALKFKPKLLLLIAPPETKSLDEGKTPYDLVWKDDEMLFGKSFYLPGSIDINGKQIDPNVIPPQLYLWSREDWTAKHREIAHQHGHLSGIREMPRSSGMENHIALSVSDSPEKECDHRESIGSHGHMASIDEMNNGCRLESDVTSHAPGHFSAPREHLCLAAEPVNYRMGTSTMEQYAPRLDESNHARMKTMGSEPPTVIRSVVQNPLVPERRYRVISPLGFAPAICQPFANNSAGWIDE